MTLYSVPQAADRLDLCPSLLRRYCREGRLGTKVGGRWLISEDELVRFESEPRPMGRPPSVSVDNLDVSSLALSDGDLDQPRHEPHP